MKTPTKAEQLREAILKVKIENIRTKMPFLSVKQSHGLVLTLKPDRNKIVH